MTEQLTFSLREEPCTQLIIPVSVLDTIDNCSQCFNCLHSSTQASFLNENITLVSSQSLTFYLEIWALRMFNKAPSISKDNKRSSTTSPVCILHLAFFFFSNLYCIYLWTWHKVDIQLCFQFSYVWLFATPWTVACQASLSITNSWSLPKLVSSSVQPHRWQPTRLLCPWDSPGKNTEVDCYSLLQMRHYRITNIWYKIKR